MALPTNPMGGFTTGQLVGELIQDQKGQDSKTKRRRNLAMGVSLLLGGGDAMLRNKHQDVINKLDESKVTDIAKNSKMFDDATELQTVQESIDSYGGGLTGALAHYDANAEIAFNTTHKDLVDKFDKTQSGKEAKQTWKESFVRDNLYKKHQLKYNEADASKISGLSREEFNKPINEYYTAKVDEANNPANKSIIHKGFQKGAEILGFNTKRDRLYENVLEAEINLNKRNEDIDKYRNVYTQQSFTIPKAYTKNTIMEQKMTETEFFQAWEGADRNPDQAEYAYQEFVKDGMTYEAFEKAQVGYLAEKSTKDNARLMEQAIAKRISDPSYEDLPEEDQAMARRIASVEAMGGDASLVRSQFNVRRSINKLIESGARGYKQLPDDPLTPNIDEAKITSPEYLQAQAWAGAQIEAIRKMTGGVNWNTVRTNWVTSAQSGLYNDIRDKTPEVDVAIKNTRIPLGDGPDSKLYGQIYLQEQVEAQYPGKDNEKTRQTILDQFSKSNYNLKATNGGPDSNPLEDGTPAYDLMMAAQQKYFVHKESQNMVQQSFIYVAELQEENKRLGY